MDKSTVPVEHGFSNPFLARASHLVSSVNDFRELAILIQQEARSMRGKGGVDIKQLLSNCHANGVKDRLRAAFNAYKAVPETSPTLGPPPPTNELYGRFGDKTAIIDIGSGNCLKLKKFTGVLKVTAVDPQLPDRDDHVLLKFKMTSSEFLAKHSPSDPIFTSYMSLCQLDDKQQIELLAYDGMHLIPNHDELLAIGAAKRDDGKVIVETGREVYADFPVPSGGYSVAAGYNLLAVFAKRDINVVLGSDVSIVSDVAVIDARPAGFNDMDLGDMGDKWDGVAYELEVFKGQAYLLDRAGRQRVGVADYQDHLCLHLEELAECFVLLRVMSHRGMVPPHCGFTLRTYAERVRLKINGKPVCGPPSWRAGRAPELLLYDDHGVAKVFHAPTDGIISRSGGRDYYCKYQWTIDIRDTTVERLRTRLTEKGLDLKGDFKGGLWEYGINRREDIVDLIPLRLRNDKKKETTMDTIIYLMDKPTLAEMQALTI